jgi:molybdopterin converting factor small subunit
MLDSRGVSRGSGVISVRLYANLAPASADGADPLSGPAEFEVENHPGLRVKDVLTARGVPLGQVSVVIVNDVRADLDAPLAEGDHVGVFPALSGG